jgi:nucleoid DNA-binding protein
MYNLKGLREIKKSGILDEERFYQLLSERCNYISKSQAKSFYLGLVNLMVTELRENGIVRLPNLGDFALIKQKDRVGLAGTKRGALITGSHVLKFYPFYALRQYFAKFGSGTDKEIDPRKHISPK